MIFKMLDWGELGIKSTKNQVSFTVILIGNVGVLLSSIARWKLLTILDYKENIFHVEEGLDWLYLVITLVLSAC